MRLPKLFQSATARRDTTVARFSVQGMSCGGCAERARKSVDTLPGIACADFNPAAGKATVTYDRSATSLEEIRKRIVAAGFTATTESNTNPDPNKT